MTEENKQNIEIIKELELQVLYFILTNSNFVSDIFGVKKISINTFKDPYVKKIAKMVSDFYNRYGKIFVKGELELRLDKQLVEKSIEDDEHYNLLSTYNSALDLELDPNQFDRILDDWLNAESVSKIKEALLLNKDLLDNNRGLDYLEKVKEKLDSLYINQRDASNVDLIDFREGADVFLDDIKSRRENPDKYQGLKTGIKALDGYFNGFEPGTLNLIIAISGTGKSTFVINIARNLFMDYDKKVLFISFEMPERQILRKIYSRELGFSYEGLLKAKGKGYNPITDEEMKEINDRVQKIKSKAKNGDIRIMTANCSGFSWPRVLAEKNRRAPNFKPDIIFLDYLGLIDVDSKNERRDIAIGNLVKSIRAYAKSENIPAVVVAQANRQSIVKSSSGERKIDINIENIEDSNKAGSDADTVMALYQKKDPFSLYVKIVKQREGMKHLSQTDDIKLASPLQFSAVFSDNEERNEFFKGTMPNEYNITKSSSSSSSVGITDEDMEEFDDLLDDDELEEQKKEKETKEQIDIMIGKDDNVKDNKETPCGEINIDKNNPPTNNILPKKDGEKLSDDPLKTIDQFLP